MTFFFLLCLVGISSLFFYSIKSFTVAILIAFLLFRYFNRVYLFLQKKINRNLAATTVVLLVLIGIVLPVSFFGITIYQEIINNYKNIEASINDILQVLQNPEVEKFLAKFGIEFNSIFTELQTHLGNFVQWSFKSFSGTFLGIISGTFNLLIILYLLYFLCLDGKIFFKRLSEFLPLENEKRFYTKIIYMTDAVFLGVIVIAICEGIIGGALLYFLGVKSFIFWSIVMMVFAMLPLLGTNTILVPFAIYLFVNGSYLQATIVLLVGLGGSTISQNIIKPKIIGDKSGMHPAFIVLSTLGGIAGFGFIGIFIGPIICALFLVFWQEFAREFLHNTDSKNLKQK